MIGCRGWNHDQWVPGFYPEDLPDDWRFCFYSNEIRGVLVPFDEVFESDPRRWREDSDDDFRFVFECRIGGSGQGPVADGLRALMRRIQPVVDRTAAILLSVTGDVADPELIPRQLLETADGVPLCIDLSALNDKHHWQVACESLRIGQVWRFPCVPSTPVRGFQVALVAHVQLAELRAILESLTAHAQLGAAVIFIDADTAPNMARQARIMAEIMDA